MVHLGHPKGRGVITTEKIAKGDFFCEYKTYKVYPLNSPLHLQLQDEYDKNGEVSFTIETANPFSNIGRLCFDATRRYCDVGWLINHAPRPLPNLKLGRPQYLREKWRVAMVALKDIELMRSSHMTKGLGTNRG